jgi:predicted RNase H-like nuclease
VIKFLLWCILLVLCWPLALLALILYPIVWLILVPFRLVGVVVSGVLDLVWSIVTLPALLMRRLAVRHQ